ncbi:MAG: helix-turn-helix domain-containing protein [Clostridia bacterium]|nr:helix-turn-helix domain-containing protein [Clostridia bacterium]
MDTNIYKSFDELPAVLTAKEVADILRIGRTTAYELMRKKDFPSLRIGNRLLTPRDKFIEWVNKNTKIK